MKQTGLACWTLLVLVAACGSGADTARAPVELRLLPPWDSAGLGNCSGRAQLATALVAKLTVGGGYEDCPLTIDPSTLNATGACEGILRGMVRPLLLTYALSQGVGREVPVAYYISYVDLCTQRPTASVDFGDPATSSLVFRPADLDALPAAEATGSTPERDACAPDLEMAKAWAKSEIGDRLSKDRVSLDLNCDQQSNLEEACAGIFPLLETPCP